MRRLLHLVGRFLRSVVARRPGPAGQALVAAHLDETRSQVFWRQPVPDLDQAVRGARRIVAAAPERDDLVRAFLLHDVGKRHARAGTVQRSLITVAALLRLPVGERGRAYLAHGERGAAELEAMGCDELTVAFARHHHEDPPRWVDPGDWELLVHADRAG